MSFDVGETVFVPNSRVKRRDRPVAVGRFKIVETGKRDDPKRRRSVRVELTPDEEPNNGWVYKSHLHPQLFIALVRIGDLASETSLLDPLTKSLEHFFRLLVGDDYFRVAYIRTRTEFEYFMSQHEGTTHVVLIAHGRKDAVQFLGQDHGSEREEWLTGEQLLQSLPENEVHILSLAC